MKTTQKSIRENIYANLLALLIFGILSLVILAAAY